MKAYELMAALSALPCNANVLLCNMTSNDNLTLNGHYDKNNDQIVLEVETEEFEAEED